MPRGFLVKRYSNQLSSTDCNSLNPQSVAHTTSCVPLPLNSRPLIYRYSDEDRSDSSLSEHETLSITSCSIPSPISVNHKSSYRSLNSLSIAPTLLSYNERLCDSELPQDVPLALTKTSLSQTDRTTPISSGDKSPSALDLRCPSFIFHFPNRMPSSAPPSLDRNISIVSCSTTAKTSALTTSKKRLSLGVQKKALKKHKVVRKLNFDEHKSSPVSGTFIRDSDSEDEFGSNSTYVRRSGDIDPSLNVVVITEEARSELAKIENKIGDYICALCKEHYDDAFGLAQHRCSRIVHVEYRCPECDKVFNCPANLASHRRWHKPRVTNSCENNHLKKTKVLVSGTAVISSDSTTIESDRLESVTIGETATSNSNPESLDELFECQYCSKKFRRHAYLKKHLLTLHSSRDSENNSLDSQLKSVKKELHENTDKILDFSISNGKLSNNEEILRDEFDKCPLCSIVFPNQISFELHAKSVHSNEAYFCKHCSRIFYTSKGLTIHINENHTLDIKPILLQPNRPIST